MTDKLTLGDASASDELADKLVQWSYVEMTAEELIRSLDNMSRKMSAGALVAAIRLAADDSRSRRPYGRRRRRCDPCRRAERPPLPSAV